MGFLDYAWNISIQKDNEKVKILQGQEYPELVTDNYGFTIKVPKVFFLEKNQVSFIGHTFDSSIEGRSKIGRLFRATVLHLTAHTMAPLPSGFAAPVTSDSLPVAFVKSLVRDAYVNAFAMARYPERLPEIAYANSLAFQRIKPVEHIWASSTRIMAAILTQINLGEIKGRLSSEEEATVKTAQNEFTALKTSFLNSLDAPVNLEGLQERSSRLVNLLEPFGPFLEAPSLPYAEQISPSSIYSRVPGSDLEMEKHFLKSMENLGGKPLGEGSMESFWRPEQDAEVLQAFNSEKNQQERKEKILAKITPQISISQFKSVSFPEEDYTQYLRARNLVQGSSRRLLDALRTALNFLDEDPRQEIGQLDLTAVIQAMASRKPAVDVFLLDELLKQSFAWSIVLDVSSSMRVKGEMGRALAIAVAEAAKELMTDPSSWTLFAFSDRLFILKDSTESYSQRVRARIGGLRFEGLTFLADAVRVAGRMLAKRFEEQRILVAISDGWPHGYQDMPLALKQNVDSLLSKGVIVIGIGVETDRMGKFFRLSSSVYTPKDLIKGFANTFIKASEKALET